MWEGLLLGRPSKQRPPELFIISIDSLEEPVNDLRVPLCTALLGYSSFECPSRNGSHEVPKEKSVENNSLHFVATNNPTKTANPRSFFPLFGFRNNNTLFIDHVPIWPSLAARGESSSR